MPLEIEVKLKVPDHRTIRLRLKSLRARRQGKVRETNIFFDRADRSLRRADSGLRVRFTRKQGASTEKALLTFKGPPAPRGLRSREAFDLEVVPPEQIVPLLQALGFEQVLLFEKDRETWLMGGCHVELDMLPHFGAFVEIEGPSEKAVRAVQKRLGLGNVSRGQESYSKMAAAFLQGRKRKELQFR